jgi:hypothetical protein
LLAGASQTFTYTALLTGSGTLGFQGQALGFDANTLVQVSSTTSATANLNVQSAAGLSLQSVTIPATATMGSAFTVLYTVLNTGQAAVNGLTVAMAPNSGGQPASLASGPQPASANVAGGGIQTFTFVYNVLGTNPNIVLQASAAGIDANSGLPVTLPLQTLPAVIPQVAPQLSAQLLVVNNTGTPLQGCEFNDIYVVLQVSNTAGSNSTASGLVDIPNPPTLFASPSAPTTWSLKSAPAVVTATVVAGVGGAVRFTWTYSASGSSVFNFSQFVSATDVNTGISALAVTTSAALPYSLSGSVQLAASLALIPAGPLASGQLGTAILTVTNTGSVTALAITPSATLLSFANNGAGLQWSLLTPAAAYNVPAAGSATFTWTYSPTETAGGSGLLEFQANVNGMGQPGSCQTVLATNSNAVGVTVVSASNVTLTFNGLPAVMVLGSSVMVTATVTNAGASIAQNVSLTSISANGVAGAIGAVNPLSAAVGNVAQTFSFLFTPAAAGSVNFSAAALSVDTYSGVTSTTAIAGSGSIIVRDPAALTSAVEPSLYPVTRSQTQSVTLAIWVTNTAGTPGDTAINVTITVQKDPSFLPLSAPVGPTTILAGPTGTLFIYTYSASAIGTYAFTVTVSGKDQFTGLALNPPVLQTAPIIITLPQAALTLASETLIDQATAQAVSGTTLGLGRTYLLNAVLNNSGVATAAAITPSALSFLGVTGTAAAPGPATIAVLGAGSSQTVTWSFVPGVVTTPLNKLTVTAGALGSTLAGPGGALSLNPNVLFSGYDVVGPNLGAGAVSLAYIPLTTTTVAMGGLVTVRYTVSNTGASTAYNMVPTVPVIAPNWTLVSGPLNDANGAAIGTGLTISAGTAGTFRWVYAAATTVAGFQFGYSASGVDAVGGAISTTGALSAGISIQPGKATPAFLAASLATPLGTAVSGPYGLGQLFTVTITVSNTASAGSSSFTSLTPSISAMGTWASATLVSFTAMPLSVTGGTATPPNFILPPGAYATWSMVLRVTQTAASTGQDTVALTLTGLFTDSNAFIGSGGAVSSPVTFNIQVAGAATVAHAVTNEMFLSKNTFYPSTGVLILNFTVKQSGNATVKIYDIAGGLVKTLFNGPVGASSDPNQAILYSGNVDPRLRWDGTADDGHPVSSGTYLIFLNAPGYSVTKKVNLLR